jgi:L-2-hydroxyglutarate oxidase LhgO
VKSLANRGAVSQRAAVRRDVLRKVSSERTYLKVVPSPVGTTGSQPAGVPVPVPVRGKIRFGPFVSQRDPFLKQGIQD